MSIIFKYIKKADKSLIGYHMDTMCQCGPKERAKQYGCETAEAIKSQTAIIQKNFNSLLNMADDDDGFLSEIRLNLKKTLYDGLTPDDVILGWEEVPTVKTEARATAIISNGLVQPVNKPLDQALKETIANIIAKKN